MDALYDIPVTLSVRMGKTKLPINQLLKVGRGAVLELDRKVNAPVDLIVNGKVIGYGEIVVVEDHLAVTVTEVLSRGGED